MRRARQEFQSSARIIHYEGHAGEKCPFVLVGVSMLGDMEKMERVPSEERLRPSGREHIIWRRVKEREKGGGMSKDKSDQTGNNC